ncbi:hypothetical protein HYDPIDRAFT_100338 [Hydnomerulius pinastri MD-312]|uniref:GST N-terminal domain-containing protein n=1 Tax=Hydnomerulius pinastri MD-312 TaxID=994086 RepID=A0A0C9W1A3_9AGAM|nr:hypothetical protein HYDPIDRAFT_100338 [Hydnomerulius pinastri MD-312]
MFQQKPIIFYDIPHSVQGSPWSPNTLKTRYTLGYKGIPFTTTWVEYPDIEPLLKSKGAKPTQVNGLTVYTLPVIEDPSTGAVISDSYDIALYLDKTYPDTPKVIPDGTQALIEAFHSGILTAFKDTILLSSVIGCAKLNPPSQEYYKRTRVERYNKKWEDFSPPEARPEQWKEMRRAWNAVDGWYQKSSGTFIMGDKPCFADFIVGGRIKWAKVSYSDNDWNEMAKWNGGRWEKLLKDLDPYLKD